MIPRLGINIDHVATLRQARGEEYPSVVDAAKVCLAEGADQITIHLREDRRHIQDTDVEAISLVTKKYDKPLNLEMGCNPEIVEIATAVSPDWICLVPENREEKTTEGGLNLLDDEVYDKVYKTCDLLRKNIKKLKISLFLEANKEILEKAIPIAPNAVEIHTGDFAKFYLNGDDYQDYIDQFKDAKEMLGRSSIACHAGHGLSLESTEVLVKESIFEEFNVGHWVICQSIFEGLAGVIRRFKIAMLSEEA